MQKEIRIAVYTAVVLVGLNACRSRKQTTVSVPIYEDMLQVETIPRDTPPIVVYQPPVISPKPIDTLKEAYEAAFVELQNQLEDRTPLDFKRAVFVVEDAYYKNALDYQDFNNEIQRLTNFCTAWMKANGNINYHQLDSLNFLKNMALYKVLKDTIYYANDKIGSYRITMVAHAPYTYDFDDFFGKAEWSKMFVSKLLQAGSGNCHSLPYLYKILADELNATAYISTAPSHFYIKNRSKEHGWYNTELTSGDFPTDAWITASGYISINAIRSGIFMDTLSLKQSIGLCMYDLAKGYEKQKGSNANAFIIRCCNEVLKYQHNNVSAMILKAETLKKMYEAEMKVKKATNPSQLFTDARAKKQYDEMQYLYVTALEMGYREMPERMYIDWLTSVEKEKFKNQKINNTFKPKSKQ